jgi:hypothetical protein
MYKLILTEAPAKVQYLATDPGFGVYDPSKLGQTHKPG